MADYNSSHTGQEIDTAVSTVLQTKVPNDWSTGLLTGGELSINANTALFDVSAAFGDIMNSHTDPLNPTMTNVSYPGGTGITVVDLATTSFTHLYLTGSATILQSKVEPTPELRRDNIYLGKLIHISNTDIEVASSQPEVIINSSNMFTDLIRGFGLIVFTGNRISANGANLSIDKSGGDVHQDGINYNNDRRNPNIKFLAGQSLASFVLGTQAAGSLVPNTVIDPTVYDNAGAVTAIGGSNNQATNYRIYVFNSGLVGVQYGQQVYSTLANAIAGLQTEPFVELAEVADNAVLLAVLSVQKGATDLSNTAQAKFSAASMFGDVSAGTGASSVSTTQDTYNNSTQPQTTTSAVLGEVVTQSGTGDDNDLVRVVRNNAGSDVYSVDGNGNVVAGPSIETSSIDNALIRTTATDTSLDPGQVIGRIEFCKHDASTGGSGAPLYIEAVSVDSGGMFKLMFYTGSVAAPILAMELSSSGTPIFVNLKSGTTQGNAGAVAGEPWRDTADNSMKIGV